jgi:hypothetical protein
MNMTFLKITILVDIFRDKLEIRYFDFKSPFQQGIGMYNQIGSRN